MSLAAICINYIHFRASTRGNMTKTLSPHYLLDVHENGIMKALHRSYPAEMNILEQSKIQRTLFTTHFLAKYTFYHATL